MISIPSAVRPNRTEPTDAVLLHDDAAPSARQIIGHMLAHAATADFAIARIRLATVDLSEAEAEGRATCRVLLGRLDAETLGAGLIADADRPTRGAQILALKRLIESGRLQVRSAGTHRWSPDFSVARGLAARPTMPAGELCMVGAHFFARPDPHSTPHPPGRHRSRHHPLRCALVRRLRCAARRRRYHRRTAASSRMTPAHARPALRQAAHLAPPRLPRLAFDGGGASVDP
jgi:hypothetical protein